jgi:hypothetical protein
MAKSPVSEIICLSAEQVAKLLEQLRARLDPPTYELVESLLRTLEWLMGIIQTQKTSLGRLRCFSPAKSMRARIWTNC